MQLKHLWKRIKKLPSNKSIWTYSPVATTFLIEGGVIAQILRMWTEASANDQSLIGWIMVFTALVLWFNWYRIFTPNQKWAKWSAVGGMAVNAIAVFTILWFRYKALLFGLLMGLLAFGV